MRAVLPTLLAAATFMSPALAAAQPAPRYGLTQKAPGMVRPLQPQQVQPPPTPLFRLFGIPVVVNAPIPPQYCNCGYTNIGGQVALASASTGLHDRIAN